MNNIITAALLCAPLTLHAAYFEQENVTFDDDGKPVISAKLNLPPLSVKTPTTQTPPTNVKGTSTATIHNVQSTIYQHSHFIYPDESYVDAINRWLKRDNIKHLAWAVDDLASSALNSAPTGTVSFEGTTLDVVNQLSRQLGVPFYMALDNYHHRAAIHQWHNREVQIAMVGGVTLKETIRALSHMKRNTLYPMQHSNAA